MSSESSQFPCGINFTNILKIHGTACAKSRYSFFCWHYTVQYCYFKGRNPHKRKN